MKNDMPDRLFWRTPEGIEHARRLLDSYRRWLGHDLIPRDGTVGNQASRLFDAPFVVLSHGTEPDPIVNYANRTAVTLWETDLRSLLATPSRMTAEPVHRDERARLLDRVTRDGFIGDYSGIRIARSGRRFLIERAIVWNIIDDAGRPAGQAATFAVWRYLKEDD